MLRSRAWWLAAGLVAAVACGQDLPLQPSHAAMMRFLLAVCPQTPHLEMGIAGHSAEGYAIPFVVVRSPDLPRGSAVRVLVIAGLAGDEPAGTTSLLQLIRSLSLTRSGYPLNLLQKTAWMLIPLAHPDGPVADAAGEAEHTGLSEEETQALLGMVESWRPHLLVDLREGRIPAPRVAAAGGTSSPFMEELTAFLNQRLRSYSYAVQSGSDAPATGLPAALFSRCRAPVLVVESPRGDALNLRAGVHVISLLGTGEHLCSKGAPPVSWPPASGRAHLAFGTPPARGERAGVTLRVLEPQEDAEATGPFEVRLAVDAPAGASVLFRVDGELRGVCNTAPFRLRLDPRGWSVGPHRLVITVQDSSGVPLAEVGRTVRVPDEP